MTTWQLIISPEVSGLKNMQFDLKLFGDFEKGFIPSTLRIYSWKPKCISLGYSQKINEEIEVKKAAELGWDMVKRPTGGGIVFHNEAEVTYSLVTAIDDPILPKGLIPSYKKISEAVIFALKILDIDAEIQSPSRSDRDKTLRLRRTKSQLCFSYPAEYEVVVKEKKIVGSAQKRGKRALLQQGSIFVRKIENQAFSALKKSYKKQNAVSLEESLKRRIDFEELSKALVSGFEERLGVKFKT